jgi:hypothetical protein
MRRLIAQGTGNGDGVPFAVVGDEDQALTQDAMVA